MSWHPDMPAEYRDAILTGDARELAALLPDASVDLVFTDPVYERIEDYRWLAETVARVLKPDGHLLAWQGVKWIPETVAALGEFLTYRWTLGLSHLNACVGTIKGDVYSHWTPLFWFSRNGARPGRRLRDFRDVPLLGGARENHAWHKSGAALAYWIDCFTEAGDVVADPFTGGGTVPAVCKQLGRHYVAFEIDPATAEKARARVRATMPPLDLEWAPDPQPRLEIVA